MSLQFYHWSQRIIKDKEFLQQPYLQLSGATLWEGEWQESDLFIPPFFCTTYKHSDKKLSCHPPPNF